MPGLICLFFQVYLIVLVARIVLSWFPLSPNSPVAGIYSFTFVLTEPVLGPLRRVLPPLGGFDLSPIVVIFGVQILSTLIGCGAGV